MGSCIFSVVPTSSPGPPKPGKSALRTRLPTLIGAVDGGSGIIGSHVAKLILYTSLFQTEIRDVCAKTFFTTFSAIISYFARKGKLLFTNSDQIEADRLCEL